jgi:hypothetical protein
MAKFTVSNQVAKGVAVTAISRAGMLLLAIMVSLRVNLGTGDSASNTLGSPTLAVTSRRTRRWQFTRRMEEARQAREASEKLMRDNVSEVVERIWADSAEANSDHPYLVKKQITAKWRKSHRRWAAHCASI